MKRQLENYKYSSIPMSDKEFMIAFDEAIRPLGYVHDGVKRYSGLGRYIITYRKDGLVSPKNVARFYLRDDEILFRMFFKNVNKHRKYIENTPKFIKDGFANLQGNCTNCLNSYIKSCECSAKQVYVIHDIRFIKCNKLNFFFDKHRAENVEEYIKLLNEFYPRK